MTKKMTKKMSIAVYDDLYYDFSISCESQYKTVSEVIRTFMLQYTKEHCNEKDILPKKKSK